MIKTFEDQFSKIQTQIIEKYCNLEPSKSCVISDDNWIRKKGGGGRTFIIEKGKFFDKAAHQNIYCYRIPNLFYFQLSYNHVFQRA